MLEWISWVFFGDTIFSGDTILISLYVSFRPLLSNTLFTVSSILFAPSSGNVFILRQLHRPANAQR